MIVAAIIELQTINKILIEEMDNLRDYKMIYKTRVLYFRVGGTPNERR